MFCPNCNNSYDITKNIVQTGGDGENKYVDIDNIIKKALEKSLELDDVNNVDIDIIKNSSSFKKLGPKKREWIVNKIEELQSNMDFSILQNVEHNKAYYICHNCGFHEEISDGTIIYTNESQYIDKYLINTDLIYDPTLPRTRNYKCVNKNCKSYTDPNERVAIFFRQNPESYKIRYICTSCKSIWE